MTAFRVAMVTPYSPPVVGGITTFVRELSESLRSRGLEVVVISRDGSETEGVHVVEGRPLAFAHQAARVIQALEPDAVHAHGHWYALQAGVAACRKSRSRLVFTFHTAPRSQTPLRRRVFLRLLSKCDYVTFPSEYLRSRVDGMLPAEKTRIVHPGACRDVGPADRTPRERLHEWKREGVVTIGYVGNFEWRDKVRGFEILLQSMRQLPAQGARLLVAGGGSLFPEIKKMAAQLELTNRVTFLGEVADPGLVYRECDIYCHPSLQEGMSLAVLEAMAAGLPIVGIKEGFMTEAVRPGVDGLLVSAEPVPLAEALMELIDDPKLAKRLGGNARSHARQEFNWDKTANQFVAMYGAHT